MKCNNCNGRGTHSKRITHEGKRFRRRFPCSSCNGTGEVPYGVWKDQVAEIVADQQIDDIKIRADEKSC